jgi:Leucine-rich repeat (LRR) protein
LAYRLNDIEDKQFPVEENLTREDIKNNDIRDIRSIRQLDKVNLDFDSPRLKQAMDDLGVSIEECMKK